MNEQNTASSRETVPVQAGEVLRRPRAEILAERAAARQAVADTEPAGHTNVREGNATVGVQADRVDGPIIIGRP